MLFPIIDHLCMNKYNERRKTNEPFGLIKRSNRSPQATKKKQVNELKRSTDPFCATICAHKPYIDQASPLGFQIETL